MNRNRSRHISKGPHMSSRVNRNDCKVLLVVIVAVVMAASVGFPAAVVAGPFDRIVKSLKKGPKQSAPPGATPTPGPPATPAASPQAPPPGSAGAGSAPAQSPPQAGDAPAPAEDLAAGHPRCKKAPSEATTAADRAILVKAKVVDQEAVSLVDIQRIDLNGDGKPDFFVTEHDCGNMRICGTTIYASQSETYIKVFGTEDASFDESVDLAIGSGVTRGFCDLNSDGVRYSWNGKAYKANGKVRPAKKETSK